MKRNVNIILTAWGVFSLLAILFTFSRGVSLEKKHTIIIDLAGRTKTEFFLSQKFHDSFLLTGDTLSVPLLIEHLKIMEQNFDSIIQYIGKEVSEVDPESPEGFISQVPSMQDNLHEIESFFNKRENIQNIESLHELNKMFAAYNLRFKEFETGLQKYLSSENSDFKFISFLFKLGAFAVLLVSLFFISKLLNRLKITEIKLVEKTVETEQKERNRIAADLHDDLGAILSSINLYLKILEAEVKEGKDVSSQIKNLRQLSDISLQRVKMAINNLEPLFLKKYGLVESVQRICESMNDLGKSQFEFDAQHFSLELSPNTELIMFRVFSELTNNALKHSQASLVRMTLMSSKNTIILNYTDDGVGFDMATGQNNEKNKIGLKSIENRIESLGGSCHLKTAPGKGVSMQLRFRVTRQFTKKPSKTVNENE
ncbi:MAG: sensor histidine kinase [Draconibacterium sp.]